MQPHLGWCVRCPLPPCPRPLHTCFLMQQLVRGAVLGEGEINHLERAPGAVVQVEEVLGLHVPDHYPVRVALRACECSTQSLQCQAALQPCTRVCLTCWKCAECATNAVQASPPLPALQAGRRHLQPATHLRNGTQDLRDDPRSAFLAVLAAADAAPGKRAGEVQAPHASGPMRAPVTATAMLRASSCQCGLTRAGRQGAHHSSPPVHSSMTRYTCLSSSYASCR